MEIIAHGHTFQNQTDADSYGKYKAEKRKKSLARKMSMSESEKQDASTRAFFAKESKRFGIK